MKRRCKLTQQHKYSNCPPSADQKRTTTLVLNCKNNRDENNNNTNNDLPMLPPVVSVTTGERKKIEIKQVTVDLTNFEPSSWNEQQYKRSAVAFIYSNHLFYPPCSEWKGQFGAISKACKLLGINRNNNKRMVENVFLTISKSEPPICTFRCLNKNLLI